MVNDFDPDKYLADKKEEGFNPDSYLGNKESPQQNSQYSPLQSAGLGALMGGSLGFADEAEGGIKALANAPGNKKSLKELYQQYREVARQKYDEAQKENPKSYLAGNLAGGVATGVATGGLGEGIAGAAGLGALTGLGSSNADLTKGDIKGAAIDTGVGGVLGAGAGALANKVGSALAPEALSQRAGAAAVRGLGGKVTPQNVAVGNTVLNEGLLPIFGGAEKTAQGITGKLGDIEGQVQQTLKGVSENTSLPGVISNKEPILDKVLGLADQSLAGFKSSDAPEVSQMINKDATYWGNELQKANGDPSKLNELRKAIDSQLNLVQKNAFVSPLDLKPRASFLKNLRDMVNTDLRDTAGQVSEGAGSDLASSMGTQSKLIQAQGMADKSAAGDLTNPAGLNGQTLASGVAGTALTALGHTTLGPLAVAGAAGKVAAETATGQPVGRLANIVSARTQDWAAKQLGTPSGQAVMKGALNLAPKGIASSGVQTGIQNVYTAKPAQLKQAANVLTNDESTKDLGNALNDAITNGDEDAKNKVLFAAEQIPSVRVKFRQALGSAPTDEETPGS